MGLDGCRWLFRDARAGSGRRQSFGVLFVELQHMYGVSAQQLGVVHGLASVLMMALVVFAGGLLIGTGFVSSAFVPSFQWLYFTYSSLTGLGAALAYAPSVVMVGHHFTKRRALANGISVSGSAVGSFVLPNLMRHLLNSYGLKGALAIIGAMMFHVFDSFQDQENSDVGGASVKTGNKAEQKNPKRIGSFKAVDIVNPIKFIHERKKLLLANNLRQISEADSWRSESSVFASAGDLALASLQNISESAAETENDDVFSTTSKGSSAKGFLRLSAKRVSKGETKSTSVPLFDWSLLVNPVFLVFFCSLICMNFGYPNVFVMLPSYCQVS
nr:hypothetical protein BaRGS_000462 [Batillaria attramentaria]